MPTSRSPFCEYVVFFSRLPLFAQLPCVLRFEVFSPLVTPWATVVASIVRLCFTAYYQTASEQALKESAKSLESAAYTCAINRRDYLERVAEALSNVELHAQERSNRNALNGDLGQANQGQPQAQQ